MGSAARDTRSEAGRKNKARSRGEERRGEERRDRIEWKGQGNQGKERLGTRREARAAVLFDELPHSHARVCMCCLCVCLLVTASMRVRMCQSERLMEDGTDEMEGERDRP